jgi:cytochrome c-type biogenesis protein
MVLILYAFIGGLVTIASPCIFPILPVVLSGASGGKMRPWGIITGFTISFAAMTLVISTLVISLGITNDVMRYIAASLLVFLGLVMLVPKLNEAFEKFAAKLGQKIPVGKKKPAIVAAAGPVESIAGSGAGGGSSVGFQAVEFKNPAYSGGKENGGYWGGFVTGLTIGIVWAPCTGPIMSSVITLAASSGTNAMSVFITLAYVIGTAFPMAILMLGGQTLFNKLSFFKHNGKRIQQVFAVLILVAALFIFTGLDRAFQTAFLDAFPGYEEALIQFEETDQIYNELEAQGLF